MKDKETETLKPCVVLEITREQLCEAIQDCWNDWVSDTGCFPDCVEMQNGNKRTTLMGRFNESSMMEHVWGLLKHRYEVARPATLEDRALDALEEICEAHSAYEHARNCSVRNVVEQKLTTFIEAEMEARALLREAGRVK